MSDSESRIPASPDPGHGHAAGPGHAKAYEAGAAGTGAGHAHKPAAWSPAGTVVGSLVVSFSPLVRIGGGLGVAGTVVGMLLFLAACHGLGAALYMGVVVAGLGLVGLALTLVGAITQKDMISEDTHVLAAMFTSALALFGGLLLMTVAFGWPLLGK